MDEKERLRAALSGANNVSWNSATLALDDPDLKFAGRDESMPTNTAGELIRIYEVREQRRRSAKMPWHGISDLLSALSKCSADAVISIQPFQSPRNCVTAFWDGEGCLLACVTVDGVDRESGKQALSFARGG